MKRSLYALALVLMAVLYPAKGEAACAWTGVPFACQVANFLRTNPTLTLGPYKAHLAVQSRGKMKALPRSLIKVLRPHYREIDFSKVRYAEGVDTLHGRAITIGNTIYLPRKIALNKYKDLHWMLHELEHVAQYVRHGDESEFIAQYVEEALRLSTKNINSKKIHDTIRVERLAREKADAVIKDVWRSVGRQAVLQ